MELNYGEPVFILYAYNLFEKWLCKLLESLMCRSFQVGQEKFFVPWLFVINRKSSDVPMIEMQLVSPCFWRKCCLNIYNLEVSTLHMTFSWNWICSPLWIGKVCLHISWIFTLFGFMAPDLSLDSMVFKLMHYSRSETTQLMYTDVYLWVHWVGVYTIVY